MPAADYAFLTRWQVADALPEEIADILTDIASFPRGGPAVCLGAPAAPSPPALPNLARWLPTMSAVLREILSLDPVKDHLRVAYLTCRCEFPFDTTRALEFALFRTFCVPSIGALLDRTREFGERAQKRYDDTDLILSELMELGYDSERGRRALARMNEIHGRFKIINDDFLYVLSTFVFEPARWNARFGWRPQHENENIAQFHFWREVGIRMHIRDVPEDRAEFERFNLDYERAHFAGTAASRRVCDATIKMFQAWMPRPLRGLVAPIMASLMDDRLRESVGLPAPPGWIGRVAGVALRLRGRLARLSPRAGRPVLRTAMSHRSYPEGYTIETLGPEPHGQRPV